MLCTAMLLRLPLYDSRHYDKKSSSFTLADLAAGTVGAIFNELATALVRSRCGWRKQRCSASG